MRVLMFPGPAHTPHTYSCASNGCRQRTVACRKVRRVWCSVWLGGLTRGDRISSSAHIWTFRWGEFEMGWEASKEGLACRPDPGCFPAGRAGLCCRGRGMD